MGTAIRTSGLFVRTEYGVSFLSPKALSRAGGFRETSSLSPLAKSEHACRSQGSAREGLLIGAGSREAAN